MEHLIIRTVLRADVSAVAPPGCQNLAVEIVVPRSDGTAIPDEAPIVFCFPGGGMSRRYFDLSLAGYSFAEYAAAAGFVTVLVDHPGVGDSDVPDDAWSLTPAVVADVDAAAVRWVLKRLRAGAVEGIPALRPAAVVGVGHSAGALLLIHQQARHASFDAVVLLGWGGNGLPEHLDETERALGADADQLASRLVEAAKRRYAEPLTELQRGRSRLLVSNRMPEDVHQALVQARSRLLTVVGFASLIPGSASHAATAIDVPVFVGVGENDIAVGHHKIPAEFPASRDITLFVLEGAGHNQNVEPNRAQLWERISGWVIDLARRGASRPSKHT